MKMVLAFLDVFFRRMLRTEGCFFLTSQPDQIYQNIKIDGKKNKVIERVGI